MSTPINPKPRLNLRFLYGILFGFFTSYTLFYFQITPFECAPCPTTSDTVTVVQCEVPKGQDEEPQYGKWLDAPDEQSIMAKFRDLPATERVNSTYGGRIGRANLQRLLNDMPPDRKWVHFRYGMIDGTDATGNTAPRLVVLFRNDVFQEAVTHSTGSGRTIMNFGFCPIDCGNN